jgi:hypothetical protein
MTGIGPSFRQAISIAQRQKALSLELRAVMSPARLLMKRGEPVLALGLLGAVYFRFTEGFATAGLVNAKALLGQLESASGAKSVSGP